MFIIYGFDHPKSPEKYYFSGIFKNKTDAEAYYNSFPEQIKSKNWIEEIQQQDYPLYLLEDFRSGASKSAPISRFDLAVKLVSMPKVKDDDYVYFNYYRFLVDYRGFKVGEDNLGTTDHHHVDNDMIYWMVDSLLEKEEHDFETRMK